MFIQCFRSWSIIDRRMSVIRGSSQLFKRYNYNNHKGILPGTYVDFFYDMVKSIHDKVAIIDPILKQNVTFGDLRQQTIAMASGLTKRGFKKGDILSLFGSNCLEFCPIIHGTFATGGVLHALKPAIEHDEFVYHLRQARPRFLVATANVIALASKAVKEADAGIEDIFVVGGSAHGCRRIEELIEDNGSASPWGKVQIDPLNDDALILQTSGTTGMSKNVVRTHEMLKHFHLISQGASGTLEDKNELVLGNIPFTHAMPLVTMLGGWLLRGIGVVIANGNDFEYFVRLINEYKISRVILTPTSISAFANASTLNPEKLQSWRYSLISGSILSKRKEEHYQKILRQNLPKLECFQMYGATEAGLVTIRPFCLESRNKMGSIGVPAPNVQMKVVRLDDHGKLCQANERGEILIFCEALMKNYFKNEAATKKAIDDGWYKSGDYGYYDEDGYFYVLDRISDLIHHKGGMIIPMELEGIVTDCPGVDDCAVIGINHSEYGAVPKAFVVSKNGISEEDIQAFVTKHVKSHERLIGGITFVKKIPKSPAGKVLRRQLL